jgi:hypothetical protein
MSTAVLGVDHDTEIEYLEAAFDALDCYAVLYNEFASVNRERSDRVSCHLIVLPDGKRTLLSPVRLTLTLAPSTHAEIVHEDEQLMTFVVVLTKPGDCCEMTPV